MNGNMEINWGAANPNDLGTMPLQQTAAYGAALNYLGRQVSCAQITLNQRPIATAQIILRHITPYAGMALMPRGPIWQPSVRDVDKRTAFSLIAKTLPLPRLRGLIANLADPSDDAVIKPLGFIPLITPQHMAELDLRPPMSTRMSAQTVKWRNRLRAAQKTRLKIAHQAFSVGTDQWLLQQDAKQRRTKGYRALPLAFTNAFAQTSPKSTRLFIARYQGTIVAAMLFLLHGKAATYHIGWINAEGRHLSAHNLLLWHASNWLADTGHETLDLGTIDTETAPGLARFKIGSGAQIRPLGATWLHTPLTDGPARLMAHIPPRRRQYIRNA